MESCDVAPIGELPEDLRVGTTHGALCRAKALPAECAPQVACVLKWNACMPHSAAVARAEEQLPGVEALLVAGILSGLISSTAPGKHRWSRRFAP